MRKPIHLAAHFPSAGNRIEFDSFVHLARTAERGLFDFVFLDNLTVLAALTGVTDRIGVTGTINTTFSEPFEVARQFATLDHLSDGRAGANIVTSPDAFTGANFRGGGVLDVAGPADRYVRAEEFLTVARAFWGSWEADAVLADVESGVYVEPARIRGVEHSGSQFNVRGFATLPAGPQGHPVLLAAGDSAEDRAFGARHTDALFTPHSTPADGQRCYADIKGRARFCGRDPNRLKVFSAATFVIGDTADEARDKARRIRHQQVSGATAIAMLEQVWGRDLSDYDPDGPLPDADPVGGPIALARSYRERAAAERLSIRELVLALTSERQFVGTAAAIAAAIDDYVQADACDGFILVPDLTPHGLDEFVDRVVPLLQERGAFRTEYAGETLREHLGLRI
jgi:FMN-dependent oxidoreductase (nitrilotriacetate monooxygenase family)